MKGEGAGLVIKQSVNHSMKAVTSHSLPRYSTRKVRGSMEIATEWEKGGRMRREKKKKEMVRSNGPSPSSRNVAVHPLSQSIVRWKREKQIVTDLPVQPDCQQ